MGRLLKYGSREDYQILQAEDKKNGHPPASSMAVRSMTGSPAIASRTRTFYSLGTVTTTEVPA